MSKKFKNIGEFFNNKDKSNCLNKSGDEEKNETVKKTNSNANSNKKPQRIRSYEDSYIKFGFSFKVKIVSIYHYASYVVRR